MTAPVIPSIGLPATLPSDGKGFSKRMVIHMNFGEDGGAANYTVHDADGNLMPITHQYDTRKKDANPTGYFLDGVEQCFSKWADLAAYWPEFIASRTGAAA